MKKNIHWLYVMATVLIAVAASVLLYKDALASYALENPMPDYYATAMLLKGMFGIADLLIAAGGVFLCVRLSHSR